MTTGQANQPGDTGGAGPQAMKRGSARRWPLAVCVLACAVLGVLLIRTSSQQSMLRASVFSARVEADRCRVDLRKSEDERKRLAAALEEARRSRINAESQLERERAMVAAGEYGAQSAKAKSETLSSDVRRLNNQLESTEKALRAAASDRDDTQSDLTMARISLVQCERVRDEAVTAAGMLRSKLEDIGRAIRIGMVGVVDVPLPGYSGNGGYDLESQHRKLVNEYNDLVRRFNAAVNRSNALGDIVDNVIRILNR